MNLITPRTISLLLKDISQQTFHIPDFWFEGCPPCEKNHKELFELYSGYKDQIEIISFNFEDSKEKGLLMA